MTDDFQSAYPALYIDFSAALPVPDYTRRNGVLDLYSHFPPGPTRPDIGPKMYNAFASDEDKGSQGTTRLHMDVADAINIMLYASRREDGTPGCAVWDLFRAEDADKIRLFLKNKFPKEVYTDPIHSQKFYLDTQLRKELFAKHGVASFRVYQYPGQAVFIPAGCAHQVCNLANCIKIALDFVSPRASSKCSSADIRQCSPMPATISGLPEGKLCPSLEGRRAATVQRHVVRMDECAREARAPQAKDRAGPGRASTAARPSGQAGKWSYCIPVPDVSTSAWLPLSCYQLGARRSSSTSCQSNSSLAISICCSVAR